MGHYFEISLASLMFYRNQRLVELRADLEHAGYAIARKGPTMGQLLIPLQLASSVSVFTLLFPKLLWRQKIARPTLIEVDPYIYTPVRS